MRYPWVNTLLLIFVPLALATGYLGLTNGNPGRAWVLWAHAAAAYAIIALLGWKYAVVARSIERHKVAGTPRSTFIAMGVVLLFVLLTGVLWATAGSFQLYGYSLLTIHEGMAVVLAVLFAWHVVARRVVFKVRRSRDRRAFLRLGLAGLAGLAVWQGSLGLSRVLNLPGAKRRFTGSYETGSFTGQFPTVSWLFDDPAEVDLHAWKLTIDGNVSEPKTFDVAALGQLAGTRLTATIDCTGGWYSKQEWRGVAIRELLAAAKPRDGAESITVTSITGFNRRFSMDEASTALLALGVGDAPLTHGHGAPARIVVPDHRGFDWVKWATRITVNRAGDGWQAPLPLQ